MFAVSTPLVAIPFVDTSPLRHIYLNAPDWYMKQKYLPVSRNPDVSALPDWSCKSLSPNDSTLTVDAPVLALVGIKIICIGDAYAVGGSSAPCMVST